MIHLRYHCLVGKCKLIYRDMNGYRLVMRLNKKLSIMKFWHILLYEYEFLLEIGIDRENIRFR